MANPAPGFKKYPDHEITIEPLDGSVEVTAKGQMIAYSNRAVILTEATYPPVIYMPLGDVLAPIDRTETATHCPFKGDASYYAVTVEGETIQDALWAYEAPFDEMRVITGFAAFYPDRVDAIKIS